MRSILRLPALADFCVYEAREFKLGFASCSWCDFLLSANTFHQINLLILSLAYAKFLDHSVALSTRWNIV